MGLISNLLRKIFTDAEVSRIWGKIFYLYPFIALLFNHPRSFLHFLSLCTNIRLNFSDAEVFKILKLLESPTVKYWIEFIEYGRKFCPSSLISAFHLHHKNACHVMLQNRQLTSFLFSDVPFKRASCSRCTSLVTVCLDWAILNKEFLLNPKDKEKFAL